jgi:hypothetical protein
MKMEILNFITNSAFSKITNLLKSPSERGQILEPLCCLYRLSLLSFYDDGVKISINDNKIYINGNGNIQGISRWYNGDARNDLHNLFNPLNRLCKYDYSKLYSKKEDYISILNMSIKGLEKLRNTYMETNIVVHSLNLYIKLLTEIKEGKENIEKHNLENSVIENHLYECFLKLWRPVNINVLNNLLFEMDVIHDKMNSENKRSDFELKKTMFNNYMEAYNSVLKVIDCNVCEIVKNVSAGV